MIISYNFKRKRQQKEHVKKDHLVQLPYSMNVKTNIRKRFQK